MILDANVLLNGLLPSRQTPSAFRVLAAPNLNVPVFFHTEVGNGLAKQVRRGLLGRAEAALLWRRALAAPVHVLAADGPELAMELALDLTVSVFDASYLVLAILRADRLVTTDRPLVKNVARRPDLARHVVHLDEF